MKTFGNLSAAPRVELLDPHECWRLVVGRGVGRVGYAERGVVEIVPVAYAVHDQRVYLRTSTYGPIARNVDGRAATLEIDDLDEEHQSGWSVVVTGLGYRVVDSETLALLWSPSPPVPWAPGVRSQWIGIRVDEVTGRRFAP